MKISISGTPADILLQSVYQSYQKTATSTLLEMAVIF